MAKKLQLLRNKKSFESKDAALTGLKEQLLIMAAGEPAIASYDDDGKKSILLGIALDETNYQIFEGCKIGEDGKLDIPQEVQNAIQEAINGLIGGASAEYNTLGKIEAIVKGIDSAYKAADTALGQRIDDLTETVTKNKVVEGNGISIDTDSENTKISVKLNASDRVLTVDGDGLLADINLTWDKQHGLKLIGKGGAEIATIAATDFVKDGMLENVELVELTEGTETNPEKLEDGTYLKFTFNTDSGAKDIYVNVTSLIDIYTAGNGINISGKEVSVKIKDNETLLKVDGTGLFIDKSALESQISDSKYNSALPDELITPSKHGGLAEGVSVATLKQKTLSQLFDDILFEEIQPEVENPSCSISLKGSWTNNGIYEVGAAAPTSEADFNVSFNRGTCTVVGQPNKYRAGTETSREIKLGSADLAAGAKITLGDMIYNLTVNHGEGDTLLTSKGNKATNADPNPLTAGSVKSSCKIFGTYPYFCNGQSTSTSNQDSNLPESVTPNTKLPLIKWTDALIGAKFASEASTETRLEFIYPKAKNITKVEFYNTVSGKWEVFGTDKYTTSATEQQTIQGVQVDYMKLTTTGAMSGALQLRFTVSNASQQSMDEPSTYEGEEITDEVFRTLAMNSTTTPFMPLNSAPVAMAATTGNRPSGVASFAVNFEPGGQSPLDARTLVPDVSDLTNASTYSNKNYYNGMTVTVLDGGEGKPVIYILKNMDDITNPLSWEKVSSEATDITLTGYVRSKETGSNLEIKTSDTVIDAFGKLEKAIIDNEEVCSKAFDAVVTAVGLEREGMVYVAPEGSNYISNATSVKDADAKLDAAIKNVSDSITNLTVWDCGEY